MNAVMKPAALQCSRNNSFFSNLVRYRFLYILMVPGLLYYVIFHYITKYGIVIAFQDYNVYSGLEGMFSKAKWVGLKNFTDFFSSYYFTRLMVNTLKISFLKILFGFPAPIILALMFNELSCIHLKKAMQTISYLPNFLSWVILAGMVYALLSVNGPVNQLISVLGGQPVSFLTDNRYFVSILVCSSIWSNVGWGSIIYIAMLTGVDPQLYESAVIDGANRFQRCIYISLPSLYNLMALQLIFSMGGILNAGFEQILMLYSPQVYQTGDIIDTFVYREGLINLRYSYSTAVGFFQSIMGFILMLLTDAGAKALGNDGVF